LYRFSTEDCPGMVELNVTGDTAANISYTLYREVDSNNGLAVKVNSSLWISEVYYGTYYDDDYNEYQKKVSRQMRTADTDSNATYYLAVTAGKNGEFNANIWQHSADVDNNSFATATPIEKYYGSYYFPDEVLCAGDKVDYYRFTIEEASKYELGGCALFGNAVATLYDKNYKKLDSRTLSKHSGNTTKYLAAGDYYWKVELSGARSDYGLHLYQIA